MYYHRLKANQEQEWQNIKMENQKLKQMIQEMGNRGGGEIEQWKKLVEQERNKASKAEVEVKQYQQQIGVS